MKIAVIDNYDSFVFNLVRYLEEENCTLVIQRNDQLNFAEINTCDAILLSPGPGIPSEAGQLLSVIHRYHSTKKILGVCLGHQAIAEYFGGKIKQSTVPIHGKSSVINQSNASILFDGIPDSFSVGRYHSWHVSELPDHFETTSLTQTQEIMSIQHSHLPIFGIQFHPESILTPNGRTIIRNWITA